MNNYKFVQIQGPFKANEDILKKINSNFSYITNVGIQAKENNLCKINDKTFEIGKRGVLVFNEVKIYSIAFLQDEPKSTLVDCILN